MYFSHLDNSIGMLFLCPSFIIDCELLWRGAVSVFNTATIACYPMGKNAVKYPHRVYEKYIDFHTHASLYLRCSCSQGLYEIRKHTPANPK